jgi:hypothetical protein
MLCIARGRWQSSRSPGRARRKPLKPFAQGMPECFGEPVVTNLRVLYSTRKAAGELITRHSLRPLFFEGRYLAELGWITPRE